MLDKVLIFELYRKKNKTSEIASIMGVSRQRIYQIITGYTTIKYKSKKHIALLNSGCAICHEKAQVIHHIDHNSHNNNIKNRLPLCIKCHGKIHRGEKHNTIITFRVYICSNCRKEFKHPIGTGFKGLFCSNKCKGESMILKYHKKGWSEHYAQCIVCSTTKTIHASKGMCKNCYARYWWHKNKKMNENLI